jgi:crotonobetainyl-CoA:carnitine CoA-transferase CaiB-like acyl-CoA transferase
MGNRHPNISPYQVFKTKDGELVIAVGNDQQFKQFAAVLGRPELAEMEEFIHNEQRLKNNDKLITICEELLSKKTKVEWKERLDAAGVPNGPINTIAEMFEDPQIKAREMIVEMEHPLIDKLQLTGSPLKLSQTPVAMRRHPPLFGEHTATLLESIGYNSEEIANLKQKNII